jgi:hypothetical protein
MRSGPQTGRLQSACGQRLKVKHCRIPQGSICALFVASEQAGMAASMAASMACNLCFMLVMNKRTLAALVVAAAGDRLWGKT